MIEARGEREVVVRMLDGESLVENLLSIYVSAAVIVGGIGMVREARLAYWNGTDYEEHEAAEPAELLAMQGNLALRDGERVVHCHLTLARRDGTVVGGHLVAATVANTVELVLTIPEGIRLKRKPEPSGLVGLYPES